MTMPASDRSSDRGLSMVFTLLILLAVSVLGAAGLSAARSGLTLASNYRSSAQAEDAAESGLVHAVSVINTYGVVTFTGDVSPTSAWSTLFGYSAKPFPGYSGIAYTVQPATSPAPSATTMTLTSTGAAPGQASRTVNAQITVTQPFSCGAIDLPGSGVTATFNGDNFVVDGNDWTMGGSRTSNPSTLGISTRTQTDANSVLSALSSGQQDNIMGTAVPGHVASVGTCDGPSPSRIANQIVPAILAQPSQLISMNPGSRLNGNQTFGTQNNPQITYFSGDVEISGNGNAQGNGIMIVDGSLTIKGNLTFTGLIIVTGRTQINSDVEFTGNATVYGAIWSSDLSVTVGGSAGLRYSLEALQYANTLNNDNRVTQKLLPQRVAVQGWSQG